MSVTSKLSSLLSSELIKSIFSFSSCSNLGSSSRGRLMFNNFKVSLLAEVRMDISRYFSSSPNNIGVLLLSVVSAIGAK